MGIHSGKAPIAPGGSCAGAKMRDHPRPHRVSHPPGEVTNNLLLLCCTKQQMEMAFIFLFKAKDIPKSVEILVVLSITEGFGGGVKQCFWPQRSPLPSRSSWVSVGCQGSAGNCTRLLSTHLIPSLHVHTWGVKAWMLVRGKSAEMRRAGEAPQQEGQQKHC